MKLNELKPNRGLRRNRKCVGHDTSNGYGRTAGHGQKGQLACTDGKTRLGFEDGQMPLFRRIPKRGFKNVNRKGYAIINLNDLNRFDDISGVAIDTLKSSGLIKEELTGVKLLTNGELKVKLTVKVNRASKAAKKAVEAAGETVEVV